MRKSLLLTLVIVLGVYNIAFATFVDNGNGTVTDTTTGLMWQQATAPTTMNWKDALAYCENLSLAGYTSWRLPNRYELQSIVDYDEFEEAIDWHYFPNTPSSWYWSSTTLASRNDEAWVVDFYDGSVDYCGKNNETVYVRAVRGEQGYNNPPDAVDDVASTKEERAVTISVLANDTDVDGDSLSVTAVTAPGHGVATYDSTTVTYTPEPDWQGIDTFTYTVSDGNYVADSATVSVTVTPVNDPPVAANDKATTYEGIPVTISVLQNDTDVDGNSMSVTAITAPAHGMAAFDSTTVTYTPEPDWQGIDTFTYTVSDGKDGTDSAKVTVRVTAKSPCPAENLLKPENKAVGKEAKGALNKLRTFRDGFLVKTSSGKNLIALYYQHSKEINKIITTNPRLALETTTVLMKTMPAIEAAVQHGNLALEQENIDEIHAIIEEFHKYAGKELAKTLDKVKAFLAKDPA